MKARTAFKLVTWIISIGLARGVGGLCTLLVIGFVPAGLAPHASILLLMSSIGFGTVAFGMVWLLYRIAKVLWMRRAAKAAPPADRDAA